MTDVESESGLSFGYCIKCGKKIPYNPSYPFCRICGGLCGTCTIRASPSEEYYLFCHKCGDSVYVSPENPLCSKCKAENFRN